MRFRFGTVFAGPGGGSRGEAADQPPPTGHEQAGTETGPASPNSATGQRINGSLRLALLTLGALLVVSAGYSSLSTDAKPTIETTTERKTVSQSGGEASAAVSSDGETTTTRVVEKLNGPLKHRSQAEPHGVTGASDAMRLALMGTGAIILLVAFFADRVLEFSGPGFTVRLSQPEVAELSTMVHERAKEEGINDPRALGRALADALALAERERAAGREPDWDAIARKATPSNARTRALSADADSQGRLYRAASDEDRKRAAYIGAAGRSQDGGEALWVQYQGAAGEFSPIADVIDWRTAEGQRQTALAIADHALGGRRERRPTQADINRLTDLISEVSLQGPGWSIPRSKAEELLGGSAPRDR